MESVADIPALADDFNHVTIAFAAPSSGSIKLAERSGSTQRCWGPKVTTVAELEPIHRLSTLLVKISPNRRITSGLVALAKAGFPVIYCQSRYSGNDSALIMEKVAIDMGNCIRHAKTELGYDKVILAAWSGGGSLSLFYQSQAEQPMQKKLRRVLAAQAQDHVHEFREELQSSRWFKVCACGFKYEFEPL